MSFKKNVVLLLTVAVFASFALDFSEQEEVIHRPEGIPLDILPDNAEEVARIFAEEEYPELAIGESITLLATDLQPRVMGFLTHENDQGTASIEGYLDCLHQYRSIRHDTHYYIENQVGLGATRRTILDSEEYTVYDKQAANAQSKLDQFGLILIGFVIDAPVLLSEEPTIPYCLKSSVSGTHLLPEDKDFYAYGIVSMGIGYYSLGIFSTDDGTLFAISLDGKLKEFDAASFGNLPYYPIEDYKDDSDGDILLEGVYEINQNDGSGDCALACLAMNLYYLISELGFTSNIDISSLDNDRRKYNDEYLATLYTYYTNDSFWKSKLDFYWQEGEEQYFFGGIPIQYRIMFNSDFLGSSWVDLQEPADYETPYTLETYTHPTNSLPVYKDRIDHVRKRVPSFQSVVFTSGDNDMHRLFFFGHDELENVVYFNPWSTREGNQSTVWENYWYNGSTYWQAYIPIYLGPGGTGDSRLVISESSEDAQFLRWSPYLNFDVKGYTVLSRDEAGQITQLSGVIRTNDDGGWQHFETEAEGELGVRYYPIGNGEPVDVFDGEEADFE